MFEPIIQEAFLLVVLFSGIPLAASAVTGLIVGIIQAATQIQDQCIGYVVKLASVTAAVILLWKWATFELINFFQVALDAMIMLGRL